ncbi:MAG TPA: hypothetical protein VHE30_02100 [Polyangiaceae bacterium]|nr:hypothetical protein [Polyangiaceae bacterium]
MSGTEFGAREVRQRLAESLARFGVAGDVAVTGAVATLHGNGPTVSVDLGTLAADWPTLPEELRQRRIAEAARRLAAERRKVTGSSLAPASSSFQWRKVATAVGAVVVTFGALIGYRRWEKLHPTETANRPLIADYDAYEQERRDRAARVCDATRSRVMRGATVGPSDVEGWVVEITALRAPEEPPLVAETTLDEFVRKSQDGKQTRVVWGSAPTLAAAEGPDTDVDVAANDVTGAAGTRERGIRLTLRGRYVIPYFDEAGRNEYLHFARVLTDSLHAEYAALYARCDGGRSFHLGSWFRGPSPAGAATALLYFMGVFAASPDLAPAVLNPQGADGVVDAAFALDNVARAATPLTKARTLALLGPEGGMISGTDASVSTIAFPFRDGNRASRASLEIARSLGIARPR